MLRSQALAGVFLCSVLSPAFAQEQAVAARFHAAAQPPGEAGRNTQDTRERYIEKLEERIRKLEKELDRVSALEKKLEAISSGRSGPGDIPDLKRTAAAEKRGVPVARNQPAEQPADGVQLARAQATPGNGGDKPKDGAANQKPEVAPQEYDIFRDQAAVLPGGGVEVAAFATYTKHNSLVQYDRAIGGNAQVRWGIVSGLEASVTVPYYYAQRVTQTGPTELTPRYVRDFGDVEARLTSNIFKETDIWPGIHVSVGGLFPTGRSPYTLPPNFESGRNAVDVFNAFQSLGHWGVLGNVTFVKTVDPLVLFAGFGALYTFPFEREGTQITLPVKYLYNMGVAFAVSEKTSLGFTLIGSYQGMQLTNSKQVLQSTQEPIIGRVSISHRIFDQNTYVEPSVAVGLSQDAPDVQIGIGLRRRL